MCEVSRSSTPVIASSMHRTIAVFFVFAFCLSYAGSQLPDMTSGNWNIRLILCGCGPLVSGLVCYPAFKVRNELRISLLGTRPAVSAVVCITPLVVLFLTQGTAGPLAVLSYFMAQLTYCFGEQFGWRHYLQNATNSMSEWPQSFLIGSLWFCWHYSFLDDVSPGLAGTEMPVWALAPVMIILLSLLSYLLGLMVKRTKSILFPVTVHILFKTGRTPMIVTGCVMFLVLILWDKLPSVRTPKS